MAIPVAPLGGWRRQGVAPLRTPERYEQGLVLLLPGIEGESFLDHSLAWGLEDGGVTCAIEILDWTTGNAFRFATHLRNWTRNQEQAVRVAARLAEYAEQYPGRPLHVVGHSGGAAIGILAVPLLPDGVRITSMVLLAVALSRSFNLVPALRKIEKGVWNFSSPFDVWFLALGTCLLGTVDRKCGVAAGLRGFIPPAGLAPDESQLYQECLRERPYQWAMALSFHWAGHLGCMNRVFGAEYVAPLLDDVRAPASAADLPDQATSHRRAASQTASGV